ncbi:MAG: phage tail protein [Pseudomonas sp.]|uniref:phage tail protein n=1 Tax=Pseudomonas sp. TaxID=306 RepID=UPI0033907E16
MNKPQSLRAALEAAVPSLKRDPERLLVFVDKGAIASTSRASLSFEYRFQLQLVLTDFSEHIDRVIVPVMAWAQANEPDTFERWRSTGDGITFEAEILDDNQVDLAITLAITEAVLVRKQPDGSYTTQHLGEPPAPDPLSDAPGLFRELFGQDGARPEENLTQGPAG